jgi:acetyl-CoA carboxylase carboxyltransferase component
MMKIIGGDVDTSSADYQENYAKMSALNEELDNVVARTMDVGQRQRDLSAKRDKLLPRERINAVLDPGSPFVEIG